MLETEALTFDHAHGEGCLIFLAKFLFLLHRGQVFRRGAVAISQQSVPDCVDHLALIHFCELRLIMGDKFPQFIVGAWETLGCSLSDFPIDREELRELCCQPLLLVVLYVASLDGITEHRGSIILCVLNKAPVVHLDVSLIGPGMLELVLIGRIGNLVVQWL